MAEFVVEWLQVVDIDGDDRRRAGQLAETLLERAPVADLRERVGGGVDRLLLEEACTRDGDRGLVGDCLHDREVVDVPRPAARVRDEDEHADDAPTGGAQRCGDDAARAASAAEPVRARRGCESGIAAYACLMSRGVRSRHASPVVYTRPMTPSPGAIVDAAVRSAGVTPPGPRISGSVARPPEAVSKSRTRPHVASGYVSWQPPSTAAATPSESVVSPSRRATSATAREPP